MVLVKIMAETKTLKIKNGEIQLIKFGEGKSPFVILPGLSYDGFFAQANAIEQAYGIFKENFTVYLIDRNLSPKIGYSVRDIADDTAEVLGKLGIENADVFGASLGGMVAQQLAINYPRLVNKLVLGSTLSRPNATFLSVLTRWGDFAERGEIEPLLSDINRTIYSPDTLKKYAEFFKTIKTDVTAEKTARFIIYSTAAKNFDVYNSLNKIKSQTLIISAFNDKITTVAAAQEIAKKLNCKYYEYKKYGHAVFDEAPDYKKRIYDFLIC